MNKKFASSLAFAVLLFTLTVSVPLVLAKPAGLPRGTATVYVSSQGLYYDTIVPIPAEKGLPWNPGAVNSFQELDNGVTAFGPGDPGYKGGRWWVDTNGNNIQEADDIYFLCPLLGPGRVTP